MTQKFDVTIIGAGIIGLGTAISILKKHPKIKLGIWKKINKLLLIKLVIIVVLYIQGFTTNLVH